MFYSLKIFKIRELIKLYLNVNCNFNFKYFIAIYISNRPSGAHIFLNVFLHFYQTPVLEGNSFITTQFIRSLHDVMSKYYSTINLILGHKT